MKRSKTRSSGVSSTAPISCMNDVLLAREFVRVEPAVGEDVGEDVERKVDVLAEDAGEIGGLLDAGLGVEVAADVLDRLGDRRARCAGACP